MDQPTQSRLDVQAQLAGKNLVVMGTTGFLGKVWLSMLLERYPDVGTIYTMVRRKPGLDPEARLWTEIAPSPVFDPLREKYPGAGFEAFFREKIVPFDGDVKRELMGVTPELLEQMNKDGIAALVNVAGVVDFNPPLDYAIETNAFGVMNLMALSRALGEAPIMHTSTCYVVGRRDGLIPDNNPLDFPFPRADELDRSHWVPENEIQECVDVVEHTKRRVEDAPRQSHLLDEAKRNLRDKHEPLTGKALDDELAAVKRRYVKQKLVDAGKERALFWGWPNIYTYTKSIGEQILLKSELAVTIVRPSIVESAVEFPSPGWCEGIQTSTPIMYLAMNGLQAVPIGRNCYYDAVPVDLCAAGMIAALGALIERTHEPVYQLCTSDVNPLRMDRVVTLTGLSKRQRFLNRKGGFVAARTEPRSVSREHYERFGAPALNKVTKGLSSLLKRAEGTPLQTYTKGLEKRVSGLSRQSRNANMVIQEFIPFITAFEYRFSAKNTRALYDRMTPEDQERLPWNPETIEWRSYWLDIHVKGFEDYAEPMVRERIRKEIKPSRRFPSLVAMVTELAERHENLVALQRFEGQEFTRVTYRDVEQRSAAVAHRLAEQGIGPGDRVILGAKNHPDWPIAYFGVLRSGAVAVPVDASLEAGPFANIARASAAKLAILDPQAAERLAPTAPEKLPIKNLHLLTEPSEEPLAAPDVEIASDALASIIYTSGTTGDPKGVMLSHENFSALVAALAPVFPLEREDRLLSVLPLHHTFEFTCGLLLPFSRGARIIYLDRINGDRLVDALNLGQVTSMVGVPAVWQLLERKILTAVKDKGRVSEMTFQFLMELNQNARKTLGIDLGRILFGQVHRRLGGSLKTLISGGSALPPGVHKTFSGLGLPLSEGYGLTEAAPVLSVAKASPKARPGHVGKAIPGVEIKIHEPDENGVGEVWARGPNVMLGYEGNLDATAQVLDDGWLRTGDLGKFDKRDHLQIVGRRKEVILTATGENVYPDDVENTLGDMPYIEEFSIVGVPDETESSNERIAILARVSDARESEELSKSELHRRAESSLRQAIEGLPRFMRPTVVQLTDVELPRTSTRKVKRNEVRTFIERQRNAAEAIKGAQGKGASNLVRNAVASIARVPVEQISLEQNLEADLGFDSLMMVELGTALEPEARHVSAERFARAATVGDLEQLIAGRGDAQALSRTAKIDKDEHKPITVPHFVRQAALPVLTQGQYRFYNDIMNTRVSGRANIPQNRNTLVIANHASHLDMGLVKFSLGAYGDGLVALAAEDYFFNDRWRRAYFENFTYMQPLDRRSGLRKAMQQAGRLLDEGQTVLIFPEGTRSPDGQMRDFMPLIGHLSLVHNVDLLPVYVGGTYRALPKGARIPLPRNRKLQARIGPALRVEDLRRVTADMKRADSYRKVAKIAFDAVSALRDKSQLDLSRLAIEAGSDPAELARKQVEAKAKKLGNDRPQEGMGALFGELDGRFVKGVVEKPTSFYFSIGQDPDGKWTLHMDGERCDFRQGRPEGGTADCVLKTSPEIFTRIVRDSYTPSVAEFMSGKVKSNDISLLQTFQKAFDL